MRAVLLIDSGSARPSDSAAAIRTAARLRASASAAVVTACFLHDARPTFAEALEGCVARGVSEVVLTPYALDAAPDVREDMPRLREAAGAAYPGLAVRLARPLGDHPAVQQVLLQRANEADYVAAHPFLAELAAPREDVGHPVRPLYLRYPPEAVSEEARSSAALWRPMHTAYQTALLVAAGPRGAGERSVYTVAERIRRRRQYAAVRVWESDAPSLAGMLHELAGRGIHHAIAVPYTLQAGDRLIERLTAEVAAMRERMPALTLLLAEHLTFDRRLVDAFADRVADALHTARRAPSDPAAHRSAG